MSNETLGRQVEVDQTAIEAMGRAAKLRDSIADALSDSDAALGGERLASAVDHELGELIADTDKSSDANDADRTLVDLAGVQEMVVNADAEKIPAALNESDPLVLTEVLQTAREAGVSDDVLADVAARITASHQAGSMPQELVTGEPATLLDRGEKIRRIEELTDQFIDYHGGEVSGASREEVRRVISEGHPELHIRKVPISEISEDIALYGKHKGSVLSVYVQDRLRQVESGEITLDRGAYAVMARAIDTQDLEILLRINPESRELMQEMADQLSRLPVLDNLAHEHLVALKILEASVGPSLGWRGRSRLGHELPDAAQRYAAHSSLASLHYHEAQSDYKRKVDTGPTHSDLPPAIEESYRREFNEKTNELMVYAFDIDHPDETIRGENRQLLAEFNQGDVTAHIDGTERQSADFKDWVVQQCLDNIGAIGLDGLKHLNKNYGIVNIGSFSAYTLWFMRDRLDNPQAYVDRPMSVVIAGQSGDYNGAFIDLKDKGLSDTVFFEMKRENFRTVNSTLDRLGSPVSKLVIAGHGGREGIAISAECQLPNTDKLETNGEFVRLVQRIAPDGQGKKNIFLNSCSQGRRYEHTGPSMAERLSRFPDTSVEAAPRVSRAVPPEGGYDTTRFDVRVETNYFYEFARDLEAEYPNNSAVKRISALLAKRFKYGTVVAEDGKTVRKNDSGIVTIGA